MNLLAKLREKFAKIKFGKSKKVIAGTCATLGIALLAFSPNVTQFAQSANTPRFNFMSNDNEMLQAANYTKAQTNWSDPVAGAYKADIGDEIVFNFYFHNGMQNTVAHNTILRALLPNEAGTQLKVLSSLSSDETAVITDTVVNGQIVGYGNGFAEINLNTPGRLEYMPGSTKIWRENPKQDGVFLRDGITSNDGINIGDVAGCWQYSGFVTFKAKVKSPAQLAIDKYVAYPGSQSWNTILENAKEGETVAWKIAVQNVGESSATNVLVKDVLPSSISYIQNTTVFYSPETPSNGFTMADGLTVNGLVVNEIKPGASNAVFFVFQTRIGSNLSYGPHGVWEGVNWAEATYNGQTVRNQAKVTVIGIAGVTISKQVKLANGSWGEISNAKIGDRIDYRITITNVADLNLTNVMVNDVIPLYTQYIAGSTKIAGDSVADGIAANGIGLGTFGRNQAKVIEFSVITTGCPPLGDYTLTNTAYVSADQVVGISDIAQTILRMDPATIPLISQL